MPYSLAYCLNMSPTAACFWQVTSLWWPNLSLSERLQCHTIRGYYGNGVRGWLWGYCQLGLVIRFDTTITFSPSWVWECLVVLSRMKQQQQLEKVWDYWSLQVIQQGVLISRLEEAASQWTVLYPSFPVEWKENEKFSYTSIITVHF